MWEKKKTKQKQREVQACTTEEKTQNILEDHLEVQAQVRYRRIDAETTMIIVHSDNT